MWWVLWQSSTIKVHQTHFLIISLGNFMNWIFFNVKKYLSYKKKTVEFQFHSRSCNVSLSINCLQQSKCHKFLKYINKQPIWIRLKFLLTQAWKRLAWVLFFFLSSSRLFAGWLFLLYNKLNWLIGQFALYQKKKKMPESFTDNSSLFFPLLIRFV